MIVNTLMTTINSRYILQELIGEGAMGMVYHALDRLTGQAVALKQVKDRTEQHTLIASRTEDATDFRVSLAREFRMLASLRHPNIISVLDYGFDEQRQPYYTMDLLEGSQTILDTGRGQPRDIQVGLLVQIIQALAFLHRRGILHRDLKPGNVLVINGQVKVLDFGLSVAREQADSAPTGTLAYMAPELLSGQPASEASDLYAVGVIAFELLTGRYPFMESDPEMLIHQITTVVPDTHADGIDSRVAAVLDRLLAKNPTHRFSDANEIIEAYNTATNQHLPYETVATRESFLQSARLVGRDAELTILTKALALALEGEGSAWLIKGESGVGKSRLIDEVRSLALVDGALVLRGQTLAERATPYQLWREGLRWLSLQTDLNELEAGILKALVPDIGTLLGYEVADAPDLDLQGTQDRLLTLIEDIFQRQSQRQNQPIVVLLEDIHWATHENLVLLARLSRLAKDLPLLIVASARDDEKIALPAELSALTVLELKRLPPDKIAELSEAMLGIDGRETKIVEYLQRETEGNVFFLIEVVRVLATKAGQLGDFINVTLPGRIFEGGIQEVVQRRLARVSSEDHSLLQIAAIAGRQLDLKLLQAIDPNTDLQVWLTACADAAVIDVEAGQWRFAHDKLREGVLVEFKDNTTQKRLLHRRIAETLEDLYGSTAEMSVVLAGHWAAAEDDDKEAYYSRLAGEQAIVTGAYEQAVTFFERAITLNAKSPTSDTAYRLQQAALERQLGEAYYALFQLPQSQAHLHRSLTLLEQPLPSNNLSSITNLVKQVGIQALHRAWPTRFVDRSVDNRAAVLEAVSAYERVAQMHYIANEAVQAIHSIMLGLNLAESVGASAQLGRLYSLVCLAASVIEQSAVAHGYSQRALEIATRSADRRAVAFISQALGVYHLGNGDWDKARASFGEGIAISKSLGDGVRLMETIAFRGWMAYYQGEFAYASQLWIDSFAIVRRLRGYRLAYGDLNQAALLLPWGRTDEALALLEVGIPLCQDEDRIGQIYINGWLAQARLRTGNIPGAIEAAEATRTLIGSSRPGSIVVVEGAVSIAEVYLGACETSTKYTHEAQRACQMLDLCARIFPIARPRARLALGRHAWLCQQPEQAFKAWHQGLAEAERLHMPYEQGLAHYEIARHLDKNDPDRIEHLNHAQDIFARLSATYDFERVRKAR
ncbi:MAG: protein kinase [Chloroflexota bacterium]